MATSTARPSTPAAAGRRHQAEPGRALDKAADLLRGRNIVGIGSPRASLESNYALRELVGAEHFYSGIEAGELERIRLVLQVLNDSPLPVPNMRDIEDHDACSCSVKT
jgi:NADH-quinone oxidoreductase subunit G